MNLSIGIVGLPNVGKSTLFNALLKKTVADAANYPFCTIEPNVGVVEVPDERLAKLAEIVQTEKIIPAVVEFYDIAGLVAGASKGEGLGNQFLAHIREVSAIAHVVRLFEDKDVVHVDEKHDPVADIKTIETELILADLATLEKQKEPKGKVEKEDAKRWEVIQQVKKLLNDGIYLGSNLNLDHDYLLSSDNPYNLPPTTYHLLSHLNLISLKPTFYVFNVSEDQLSNPDGVQKKIDDVMKNIPGVEPKGGSSLSTPNSQLFLCAKLENEVLALSQEEQMEYLNQYNLDQTGLNRLISKAYETLNLISFLTAGEKEARAWTIQKGTLAPQAAATIHTDFEKHFIKADIVPYPQFVETGGWTAGREKGKVQIVGRDYEMKDGDVVEFKIGR
jgi:hypothetical protein